MYAMVPRKVDKKYLFTLMIAGGAYFGIIVSFLIFFDTKNILFAVVGLILSFSLWALLVYYFEKQGYIGDVRKEEIDDFKVLLEVDYHIADLHLRWRKVSFIVFCVVMVLGMIMLLYIQWYFAFSIYLLIFLTGAVSFLYLDHKLNLNFMMTDKGIITTSRFVKEFIRWSMLSGHRIDDDFMYITMRHNPVTFKVPLLDKEKDAKRILKKYIK